MGCLPHRPVAHGASLPRVHLDLPQNDPGIVGKFKVAQVLPVISWCTHPGVYLLPIFADSAQVDVSIQMDYCVSDIPKVRCSSLGCDFRRSVQLHGFLILRMMHTNTAQVP